MHQRYVVGRFAAVWCGVVARGCRDVGDKDRSTVETERDKDRCTTEIEKDRYR